MIWPADDDWRLEYARNLLDENALELTTGLVPVRMRRLRAIRDFIVMPDSPRIGPGDIARLHREMVEQHNDPEWLRTHSDAATFYEARAAALIQQLTAVVEGAKDPDPDDVAAAMWLWEQTGREPVAGAGIAGFLRRLESAGLTSLAAGTAHALEEYYADPGYLARLGSQDQLPGLRVAAAAAIALARLEPDRAAEMLDRAVWYACRGVEAAPSETAGETLQHLHETAIACGAEAGSNRYRTIVDGYLRSVDEGRAAALAVLNPAPDALLGANRRYGMVIARGAIWAWKLVETKAQPEIAADEHLRGEAHWHLLRPLLDAYSAPSGESLDLDSLYLQTRVALCSLPDPWTERVSRRLLQAELDASRRTSAEKRARVDHYIAATASWRDAPGYPEGTPGETRRAVEIAVSAGQEDLPRWLLLQIVARGQAYVGVAFTAKVCRESLASGTEGPTPNRLCLVALDQLAASAAGVDAASAHRASSKSGGATVAERARQELIRLADHPPLTALALERLPFHRMTRGDTDHLRTLLRTRLELHAQSLTDDVELWRTECVELSLLRALDSVHGSTRWGRSPR